jgi:hypothetical protein
MPLKLAQADAERPKSPKIGRLVAGKLHASAKPPNVATVDVSTKINRCVLRDGEVGKAVTIALPSDPKKSSS